MVSSTVIASSPASRPISAHSSARASGSRPVVGSSRKSTAGRCTSPIATSSLRLIPPDQVLTSRSAASAILNRRSSQSARSRAVDFGRAWMRATSIRFSRPVAIGSLEGCWGTRPMRRRTPVGSAVTSTPATIAVPSSGRDGVPRILTVVDLPRRWGRVGRTRCRGRPRGRARRGPGPVVVPSRFGRPCAGRVPAARARCMGRTRSAPLGGEPPVDWPIASRGMVIEPALGWTPDRCCRTSRGSSLTGPDARRTSPRSPCPGASPGRPGSGQR